LWSLADGPEEDMTRTAQGPSLFVVSTLTGIGVVTGVIVAVLTCDVILGVIGETWWR
jgi:hypothetical protein